MSNQSVNTKCEELLEEICDCNHKLSDIELETVNEDNQDVGLELISKRQHLLELLFADSHADWLTANSDKLQSLKSEIDNVTQKYQTQLDLVKERLLKSKQSQKGVKAYQSTL